MSLLLVVVLPSMKCVLSTFFIRGCDASKGITFVKGWKSYLVESFLLTVL